MDKSIPFTKTMRLDTVLPQDLHACNLDPVVVEEISKYQDVANQIIDFVTQGGFKGRTFTNMAKFVDTFGPRVSGSLALENSIDYMIKLMNETYGLDNVHGEECIVPQYYRGQETAEIIEPRRQPIAILGLVPSVGTPPEGITAPVLVVKSFKDLELNETKAQGKIIVYNQGWLGSYGETVAYRSRGAVEAAKVGGVASLIQSVAPFSMDTPHTGGQNYAQNVTEIPTACITAEIADLLYRLQENGETITINLKMLGHKLPAITSRNVVGEIIGSEKPNEIVGISGHIDSWDVGQGAMDDAGGVFISVETLALLKALNLTPRRTLRAILWTSEEVGLVGVADYVAKHKAEMANFNAIFESDSGTFRPSGLDFAGTEEAGCIVNEVLQLLAPIHAANYSRQSSVGSDISMLIAEGVPGLSLNNENDEYFWYHHTHADTLSVQDTDEMDLCTAVWAVTSYVIADLSISLPREQIDPQQAQLNALKAKIDHAC